LRNIAQIGTANIEPSVPHVVGRQQHRSSVEAGTPKDYYKRALTIPLLYHLISEIDTYFDANNDAVMSSLLCLFPALLVPRQGNPVQAALQYYADDLPSSQVFDVAAQMAKRGSRPTQKCSSGIKGMQPRILYIHKLLRILLYVANYRLCRM